MGMGATRQAQDGKALVRKLAILLNTVSTSVV